jgi:hypothetical protein
MNNYPNLITNEQNSYLVNTINILNIALKFTPD